MSVWWRGAASWSGRVVALAALGATLGAVGAPCLHAQEAGQAWRLSPRPVVEVGGADAPPEELFSRIVGAIRLDDGRFVVADREEVRLSVVTADGRVERTIGGTGEGPGEFRFISGIWKAGGDTIGVWDSRMPRLTRFLPDGEVVRADRPAFGPGGSPVPHGNLDMLLGAFRDGRIGLAWVVALRRTPGEPHPDEMVFGLFGPEGRFLRLLGRAPGIVRVYTSSGGGPHAFSPYPWPAVVQDTLAYTDGLHGEILFFDPASAGEGPARTLSVPGRRVELADAWDAYEAALEGASPRRRMLAGPGRGEAPRVPVPRLGKIFADDAGRLWLKEYDPSTDPLPLGGGRFRTGGRWKVVETDGTVAAHLDMPDDVAPIAVYGDQLLGVARDELDVERFVVHRILR